MSLIYFSSTVFVDYFPFKKSLMTSIDLDEDKLNAISPTILRCGILCVPAMQYPSSFFNCLPFLLKASTICGLHPQHGPVSVIA